MQGQILSRRLQRRAMRMRRRKKVAKVERGRMDIRRSFPRIASKEIIGSSSNVAR
jgi:hypothetical protein